MTSLFRISHLNKTKRPHIFNDSTYSEISTSIQLPRHALHLHITPTRIVLTGSALPYTFIIKPSALIATRKSFLPDGLPVVPGRDETRRDRGTFRVAVNADAWSWWPRWSRRVEGVMQVVGGDLAGEGGEMERERETEWFVVGCWVVVWRGEVKVVVETKRATEEERVEWGLEEAEEEEEQGEVEGGREFVVTEAKVDDYAEEMLQRFGAKHQG